jgi:hypothetical protein
MDGREESAARYFDDLFSKLAGHPGYSENLRRAAAEQRQLVLNFHTHGPGHGYCVSIGALSPGMAVLGEDFAVEELAHIRGMAREREEGEPLLRLLADELVARYGLEKRPEPWYDGRPAG